MKKNIVSYFEDHANHTPHAIAVECGDKQWTYFMLDNYANYIAHLLIQQGIEQNSVIAVMGQKSFEMIAAIIAILKLNCCYMPIDVSIPESRIEYMLNNAKVKYIVSHGISFAKLASENIVNINLNYAQIDKTIFCSIPNLNISEDSPAYVMHTSGSTGMPKAVQIPHRGVVRLLVDTNYIQIKPNDSILFHSNTSFDAAIFEVWSALLNGARLIISTYTTGDISAVYKICEEKGITILLLTTGLFHIFSTMPVEKLIHLRYLVVGGDVMHSGAAKRTLQQCPTLTLINGYGPAENTVFTTCFVMNHVNDVTNPIPIGKAISGTKLFLLSDKYEPVEKGEIGEIFTSGEGVALEYINSPELNNQKFIRFANIDNNAMLYRTGDLAKELPTGDFEFVGRRDMQVKIRGYRVDLTEIEYMISSLEFVEDVCVCTIEKPERKIVAYVKVYKQLADQVGLHKSSITSYLKQNLPPYCIPSYIDISNDLPITSNGKIDRKTLQNRLNSNTQNHLSETIE